MLTIRGMASRTSPNPHQGRTCHPGRGTGNGAGPAVGAGTSAIGGPAAPPTRMTTPMVGCCQPPVDAPARMVAS